MLLRHRLMYSASTLLVSCVLAGAAGHAAEPAAAPPPINSFFENPTFAGATLSPSARHLAARVARAGKGDALAVIDLANNTIKVVAGFTDSDVGPFNWVNDERLVFSAVNKDVAQGERRLGPGLFAVNRDGSAFRQLVDRVRGGRLLPMNTE
ncbi:MAG: S9 family peptidase, partial [Pseudomonadota bacterium]|nr:S9 family peptidase [Pseudomonadota bacterium]